MKKLNRLLAFVFLCCSTVFIASAQPVAVQKTNSTKVYAHYMPWYEAPQNPTTGGTYTWGWHWTMNNKNPNIIDANGKRQIASHYYPMIGPYASIDPAVVEYHLLLMKLAGIDGVLMDWYGSEGSNGDVGSLLNNSNAIINKTSDAGLQFGLVLEDRFWSNIQNARNSITYAKNNYFTRSNFIKVAPNNTPLVGVFGPITYQTPAQWTDILSNAGQDVEFLPLWYENGDAGTNADGEYAWVYSDYLTGLNNFYANRAPGLKTVMGVAYPGFHDYYAEGGAGSSYFYLSENNGTTLNETLAKYDQFKTNLDFLQLATWNDFGEGTIFEPTVENGYKYLVRIQQYTGVSYTQADLEQVYRLFTLRKKYLNDAAKQTQLNQVFSYFASLQIASAVSLMNTVDGAAPVVSSAATASGTVGTAFNYAITASNSPTSYAATNLPGGLTVNTTLGVITGTPTTAGTFTSTVSAINAGGSGTKAVTITISNQQSTAGDVVGKITVGYQGWFAATGDGSPINAWWHYSQNWAQAPSSTNNAIKSWPDVRDYTTTFQTGWANLTNGQPAKLFSSFTDQSVNTHFLWMQQNNLDVAALQRFNPNGQEGPVRDAITAKVKTAAETYGRKFYIMYDVSGWTNMQSEVKTDWTNKMSAYTSSSAYAKQNGKPVVCIWGFGFNDANHPWAADVCLDVINWFKTQGCYVIGGVPTYWRTGVSDSRTGYINTYKAFNMLSPWMVGRIGNVTDVDNFYTNVQTPDQSYCTTNGIDYQPCVLPGDLQARQRVHGDFMWRQFYNMKRVGCQGIYISMFDEYNEGNQIAKTVENTSFVPAGSSFLALNEDGTAVSSDYYMRLSGDGGKMFKGQTALTPTRPTPYFVTTATQTPYGGTARNIPGTIQAEDFDNGGQGIAYNDVDVANSGSQYRTTEGVDIETCSEGGYNVGWTNTGEWLEYTVNILTAGTYTLQVRVATPNAGKTIHIELDGVNISGTISIPNTGGWQTWETVSVTTPALTTGQKILKIAMDSYDYNLNYLVFSLNSTPAAPVVSSAATASGTVGTAFNYSITASNSPASFAATALPAGLSVNTSIGVISGTPTTAGTFNSTVSATNAGGTGTKAVTITIAPRPAPVVSSAATASGTVSTAFNYTITASNSPESYSATALPAGLSVNTSTGVISGIPTTAGTFNSTVSATNTGGTGTKTVTITITAAGDPAGVITCYKAPGTITVDGNLNENGWKITRAFSRNVTGTTNNTATFGVLWDNTNLYVGIKILDANLYSESVNVWDDDAVEIYIDANYNRSTTYDGRDNQIIKNYNKTTVYTKVSITGLQHALAAISGGYTAEFAIPWSQLSITAPAAGINIGFDVGYDDDDNGGARDGQAVWNGTINNYQNTAGFGTLTLNATVSSGSAARPVTDITIVDDNIDVNTLKLIPNPVTNGVLTVDADDLKGDVLLEIRDFHGSLLQRESRNIQNEKLNINVASLNTGAYIILLRNNGKVISGKFLVK